jgi:FKBP-type peptidyl-prolyl cis-trans isomerase (trigger factor)
VNIQIVETLKDGLLRRFLVEIPASTINSRRDERLREINREVSLPGYKLGDAPHVVLMQKFGVGVLTEIIEETISSAAREILSKEKSPLADGYSIEGTKFDESSSLKFQIIYEILPDFIYPDFANITVSRPKSELDVGQIDATLAEMAWRHGALVSVEPRAAVPGDTLVCDVVGRMAVDILSNPTAKGAVVGSPGVSPPTWWIDIGKGLEKEIRATGTEGGLPYFDLAIYGQAVPGTQFRIVLGAEKELKVNKRDTLSIRFRAKVVDGVMPAGATTFLGISERSESDFIRSLRKPVELGEQELSALFTTGDDARLGYARPVFQVRFSESGPVNLTLRIGPARVFRGAVDPETPPLPGCTYTDVSLTIGEEVIVPGLDSQLVGRCPGDTFDAFVVLPDSFPVPEAAGQIARFTITIKALKERRAHPINDELAKKGGFDDMTTLRASLHKNLARKYASLSDEGIKKEILDKICAETDVVLPKIRINKEFKNIVAALEKSNKRGNINRNYSAREREKINEECLILAKRRVKLQIILQEIARRENISVTDSEKSEIIRNEMKKYPGKERDILKYYKMNQGDVEAMSAQILYNKIMNFIMGRVVVLGGDRAAD